MPRHGNAGITRSKLEVDECIAAALSKNNCASHEEPSRRNDPSRETLDGGFHRNIAQRPMRDQKEEGDYADL
jgi:hypothetical protein